MWMTAGGKNVDWFLDGGTLVEEVEEVMEGAELLVVFLFSFL